MVSDELLDPATPFYIRLRNVRKSVSFKVLSFLTSKTGGKVHYSRVPTCYKTTDFCEPDNKYVNFCRHNTKDNFKAGKITKEDGSVYLLVNTHTSAPDTCKDDAHRCCAYVNGQNGVCKVSQFEEEGDDKKGGKGKGKGKAAKEEDEEDTTEEKVVEFGGKQPEKEKEPETEETQEKKSVIPVRRVGKSLIVKREEGEDEEGADAAEAKSEDEEDPEEEDKKRTEGTPVKKSEEEEEEQPEQIGRAHV